MSGFNRDVVFTGDGSSMEFYDVLPTNLTIRRQVPDGLNESFMGYTGKTIFVEVNMNPYFHNDNTEEFLSADYPETRSVKELYDVIKRVIERRWDPSKLHVVGHSSGYDSRIVSTAIKELGEKNGKEWLGDVVCVEVFGEGFLFNEIMKKQGFAGIVYSEEFSLPECQERWFNFKNFHKKFNGVSAFPVNQWWDAYDHLEECGILDRENTQCFTGFGANETMEIAHKKKGFDYYFKWFHHLQLQTFRTWGGEWVHPFWDYEYLNALAGFTEAKEYSDRIAERMVNEIAGHLSYIPRIHSNKEFRTLSDTLLLRAQEEYDNSWYGREVKLKLDKDFTNYRPWWYNYCVASMCEYLLEKGYKIKFI